MNRNEEYDALLLELKVPPDKLQLTEKRALLRYKALQRKKRTYGLTAGGMVICLTVFALLVNLSVPFARACGNIPLLRELAKAVAWSPSLSAAVENAYVQPIGQSQTVNGITATVEYLIVDQKQLNIFFTLKGSYHDLSADIPHFYPDQESFSVSGADYLQPPGTLLCYVVDYMDRNVPDNLTMTFGVTTSAGASIPANRNMRDDLLSPEEPEKPDYLAEFTFHLSFDPQFTQQGETLSIDQTFLLDGQVLTITDAEIYPTHMRLMISESSGNENRLTGLDFYLENEDGLRFYPVSQGIVSSGTLDEPLITSYRLESPYFANSRQLTLHITKAQWQTPDARRVRVDLSRRTAEPLPEDVEFLWAEHRKDGWIVAFASPMGPEGGLYNRFSGCFWDEAGEEYEINARSMTIGIEDPETGEISREDTMFTETLPLAGLDGDIAYLEIRFDRVTDSSVTIPIK